MQYLCTRLWDLVLGRLSVWALVQHTRVFALNIQLACTSKSLSEMGPRLPQFM